MTNLYIDEFAKGFLTALLWTGTDVNDEPLDDNYSINDIDVTSLRAILSDLDAFVEKYERLFVRLPAEKENDAGHYFLLTRNGHGSNFLDADLGELGDLLYLAASKEKPVEIYVGDDNKLYI